MGNPKNPWDSIEKLSILRREVLKIHPIYRRDYEAAFQDFVNGLPPNLTDRPRPELREAFIYSPQAVDICRRWGLNLALHPDDEILDSAPESAPLLFADPGNAVKVISCGPVRFNPSSKNPWDLKDLTPAMVESCDPSQLDMTSILREGRYLRVEIDLFKTMGQIKAEIEDEVEFFQAEIHRSPKFESGPQTIESPIPFELLEGIWKLRRSPKDQPYNTAGKAGRGPSLDIYLAEQPASGPVNICQVWSMNKNKGKSPWKITQELYPYLKNLTEKECMRNKCPQKIDFKNLIKKNKETNNKFCGKKESCLIAKALLKNVRGAIARVEKLIASVSPKE